MRALFFALLALLSLFGCSRESAAPSPGTEGGAPADTHPASSATMTDCVSARVSLETILTKMPTACKSASDCDGYYLRPSACEAPVVLAKPGAPLEFQAPLERLQADARRACPPDPACSPRPFRADCRAGRCVDTLAPPRPTMR